MNLNRQGWDSDVYISISPHTMELRVKDLTSILQLDATTCILLEIKMGCHISEMVL